MSPLFESPYTDSAYDRWLTTSPADHGHAAECNCPDCHAIHVSSGEVAENSLTLDFKCCKDEFAEMVAAGRACARHPFSYVEPGYCEGCADSVFAKFAFYIDFPEIPDWKPEPSYFVTASDHPMIPLYGNVGADQLKKAGVDIPETPSYKSWVAMGRPVYRGEVLP